MHAVDRERHEAALSAAVPISCKPGNAGQRRGRVLEQRCSWAATRVQADAARDSRSRQPRPTTPPMFGVPASKRCGSWSQVEPSKETVQDHVAAALPGRHRGQHGSRARTARRCRSGRTSCAPRRRRSRSRAPARRPAVRHGLGAVDQTVATPRARAAPMMSAIGSTVPSAFETCASATRRVRGPSSRR